MNKVALILLTSLVLGSCGCEKTSKAIKPYNPGTNEQEQRQNTPEGEVRVPLESAITGVQPMTGIVLWNTSGSRNQSYVQLEYSYMLYSDVCKEKDVFDWSPMDRLLADVASRGHQAVVRFRYTYPGKKCAVPDYIKSWPG